MRHVCFMLVAVFAFSVHAFIFPTKIHYKFDGDLKNTPQSSAGTSVSKELIKVDSGSVTYVADKKNNAGHAARFGRVDSINYYCQVPQDYVRGSDQTFTFWFKLETILNNVPESYKATHYIFCMGVYTNSLFSAGIAYDSTQTPGFYLEGWPSAGFSLGTKTGFSTCQESADGRIKKLVLAKNTWYHVVISRKPKTSTSSHMSTWVYINGSLVMDSINTDQTGQALGGAVCPLRFYGFHGVIDEFAAYDVAVDSSLAKGLYAETPVINRYTVSPVGNPQVNFNAGNASPVFDLMGRRCRSIQSFRVLCAPKQARSFILTK